MKQIIVNPYVCDLSAVRQITRESLAGFPGIAIGGSPAEEADSYFLSWGDPVARSRNGIMETGFFWDAMHIDTIGLYAHSSLNTPAARDLILSYKAPRPAAEIILNGGLPASKYRQAGEDAAWDGVVLALQNPADRSIHRGSSTAGYYQFVEDACRFYGRHLFLKLHPWNGGEVEQRFRELALRHGCQIGRVNHSVIASCKFVLVYNSTFVVDCLVRGVNVAQFAPGYFYQCPGVNYTAFQFPDHVDSRQDEGFKLCDFLVWRYCFSQAMPVSKLVEVFRLYAESKELFPLTEALAYGANLGG